MTTAEKWVTSLGKLVGDQLVVLGAQSQSHIQLLSERYPEMTIHIVDVKSGAQIDINPDHVFTHIFATSQELMASDFYRHVVQTKPLVLTSQASWGGTADELMDFFANLTGRSVESLKFHLLDLGIDVKAVSIAGTLATIKDVIQVVRNHPSAQKPSILVMKELIK